MLGDDALPDDQPISSPSPRFPRDLADAEGPVVFRPIKAPQFKRNHVGERAEHLNRQP